MFARRYRVAMSACQHLLFTGTYDTAQVKLTLLHAGAIVLLGLWAALKIAEWKTPFSRQNFPFLFPIFAYLGWNIISFICGPFHLESAEEFIRLLMYGGIMMLIATEFTQKDIRTLTKFIIIAAWISFAYGALQIVDGFWPGADFLPWRGFFTRRIFPPTPTPIFWRVCSVCLGCRRCTIFGNTQEITTCTLGAWASRTILHGEQRRVAGIRGGGRGGHFSVYQPYFPH